MSLDIARTTYAIAVQGYDFITRGLNAGRQSRESQKAIFEEESKEEQKRVQLVADTEGKVIRNYKFVRYTIKKKLIKDNKSKYLVDILS